MRHNKLRWRVGLPSLMLALFSFPATLIAGYVPTSSAQKIVCEWTEFVGDFKNWNAGLNNEPFLLLEEMNTTERGEVVLALFWLWLHRPEGCVIDAERVWFSQELTKLDELLVSSLSAMERNDTSALGQLLGTISLLGSCSLSDFGQDNESNSAGGVYLGAPSSNPDPGRLGDPIVAPEPASLTLLGIAAVSLLVFRMSRRPAVAR